MLKNFTNIHFINKKGGHTYPINHKHFYQFSDENIKNFTDFEQKLPKIPDFYIIIVKNPYSWFFSFRTAIMKSRSDLILNHEIIEKWNDFYRFWFRFAVWSDKVNFVQYEELLMDLKGTLKELAECFDVKMKKRITNPIKVPQSKFFRQAQRDYYVNEEWKSYIGEYEENLFENYLDKSLAKLLGYDILY